MPNHSTANPPPQREVAPERKLSPFLCSEPACCGCGLVADGGSMIFDDDGDLIGRVYTVAEVCDELWPGVR